jgi:hypothetical protein
VKFTSDPRFNRDFRSLPSEHRKKFLSLIPAFNSACDAYLAHPGTPWPANLRVKPMVSAKGIWEMTWSFSGPDGRTTFDFVEIDGAIGVRWRRIGRHNIFEEP